MKNQNNTSCTWMSLVWIVSFFRKLKGKQFALYAGRKRIAALMGVVVTVLSTMECAFVTEQRSTPRRAATMDVIRMLSTMEYASSMEQRSSIAPIPTDVTTKSSMEECASSTVR